jgi:hypothetical protein
MRTSPRKLRPFRPSALALEAICPVSSLATALPLAASALGGESGTPQARHDQSTRHPAVNTPIVAAPRTAPKPMPGPGRPNLGVGPVLATASPTATPATAPTALVNPVQPGNAITLASANVPVNRPSSGTQSPPTHGGGGAPAQAPVRPMSAPAAPGTATVAPPPPVLSLPTTGATPAPTSPPTGIRPMTLAATPRVSAFATPTGTATVNDQTFSGSEPGSYSTSTSVSYSNSTSTSVSYSTSTSQEDVHVFISGGGPTGAGGRDGINPPSAVVQGMKWSGSIMLSGGTSGNYDLVKYKWTFPTGAMKGYGTFTKALERDGELASQYESFSGQPTGTDATEVKAVGLDGFTADDLEYDATEQGDHVISTFYWGPEATGVESVSVTATVKNRLTGATQELTDKVNLNVIKPDGQITVQKKGTPGVSDDLSVQHPDVQALQIDKNAGERDQNGAPLVGIQYVANVKDPMNTTDQANPTGFGGSFLVTQTINYSSTRTTADSNNVAHKWEDGVLANGAYPSPRSTLDDLYAGAYVRDPSGAPVARLETGSYPNIADVGDQSVLGGNDSPSTPLRGSPTTSFYTRDDSYVTTLMYTPETQDYSSLNSILVPVASLSWSWNAKALYDPNQAKWVDYGTGSKNIPDASSPTKDYPQYTHTFNEVRGNWVDRGPTTPPVPPK